MLLSSWCKNSSRNFWNLWFHIRGLTFLALIDGERKKWSRGCPIPWRMQAEISVQYAREIRGRGEYTLSSRTAPRKGQSTERMLCLDANNNWWSSSSIALTFPEREIVSRRAGTRGWGGDNTSPGSSAPQRFTMGLPVSAVYDGKFHELTFLYIIGAFGLWATMKTLVTILGK